MVLFGQIVVGPPGSGKTTYCTGMQLFMDAIGRKCAIVNLDFANDHVPYTASLDVRDLIKLEDVMELYSLGPNGGLVYCMEHLLDHIDWLIEKIDQLQTSYIIFDCPGQVELYTHHDAMHDIIQHFQRHDYRLASIFLIDSFYCCEASTFISAVLVVASSMLRLGLPHISILTKIDLLSMYGPLPFKLDFFTELVDLTPLLRYIDGPVPRLKVSDYSNEEVNDDDDDDAIINNDDNHSINKAANMKPTLQERHRAMSATLCETLNDVGLVTFLPLDIQNKELVGKALAAVDRANGYSFVVKETARYKHYMKDIKSLEKTDNRSNAAGNISSEEHEAKEYLNNLFNSAAKNFETLYSRSLDIQEKYDVDDE